MKKIGDFHTHKIPTHYSMYFYSRVVMIWIACPNAWVKLSKLSFNCWMECGIKIEARCELWDLSQLQRWIQGGRTRRRYFVPLVMKKKDLSQHIVLLQIYNIKRRCYLENYLYVILLTKIKTVIYQSEGKAEYSYFYC